MTANARDEKWSNRIDWSGGSQPLEEKAFVEIETREGHIETGNCSEFYWLHDREPSDIIAYRYKIKEPEVTEAEEEAWQAKEREMSIDEARSILSTDNVNHPPHYQSDNGIECIEAIRAALGKEGFIAYCRGNVIKYQWRIKSNPAEDQGKAAWYANKAREALEE